MNKDIIDKIRQRRLQILVHSCIYYEFDTNIISDNQWSNWARELVKLQQTYPKESQEVEWADAFSEFDGSTGMDLPLNDEWVRNKAMELLHYKGGLPEVTNKQRKENEYLLPKPKTVKKSKDTKRRKLF